MADSSKASSATSGDCYQYPNGECGCAPELSAEIERLRALADHYHYWFGDSCPCDDDVCPVADASAERQSHG